MLEVTLSDSSALWIHESNVYQAENEGQTGERFSLIFRLDDAAIFLISALLRLIGVLSLNIRHI